MDNFYSDSQRQLQDEFASRGLADRLAQFIIQTHFDDAAQQFVEEANFFFLSSVDANGFPTVSHKGGDPGFVKIIASNKLLFPCYDGNGMYFSAGNMAAHPQVGLLFINFENPHRVRIQGHAELIRAPETLALWPETALAVEVTVDKMWVNCPRYIQKMTPLTPAEHIPRDGVETPRPEWKSLDAIADVVPPLAHTLNKSEPSKDN